MALASLTWGNTWLLRNRTGNTAQTKSFVLAPSNGGVFSSLSTEAREEETYSQGSPS